MVHVMNVKKGKNNKVKDELKKRVNGGYITTRENSTGSNKQLVRACNKSGWWGKKEMIGRKLMKLNMP